MVPTQWLLARIIETHSGKDGVICVATIQTAQEMYTLAQS